MQIKDIHAALRTLDPENDDHWTIDGAPRLDALIDLVGMTREKLNQAAPLFSRTNLELPDYEAIKAAVEEAERRAIEAEQAALKLKQDAKDAASSLAALDARIQDSHSLTRANQKWLESQNKAILERVDFQKRISAVIGEAGGVKNVGKHPIEVNEAARIRSKRRNVTLPAGK